MEKALKPIAEAVVVNLATRYVGKKKLKLLAIAEGYVMYKNGTEIKPNIMELGTWLGLPEETK